MVNVGRQPIEYCFQIPFHPVRRNNDCNIATFKIHRRDCTRKDDRIILKEIIMAPGERILIVESDPDIADLIGRQSLKPLGYQVAVVGDAASAIKTAVQSTPDLIVANLNLPGLSGKDLLTALSSQGVKTPVVMVAEKGQEADALVAFRLGATDALFWPARDAEVVACVERALSQTKETRERQKLDRQLKVTHDELQKR